MKQLPPQGKLSLLILAALFLGGVLFSTLPVHASIQQTDYSTNLYSYTSNTVIEGHFLADGSTVHTLTLVGSYWDPDLNGGHAMGSIYGGEFTGDTISGGTCSGSYNGTNFQFGGFTTATSTIGGLAAVTYTFNSAVTIPSGMCMNLDLDHPSINASGTVYGSSGLVSGFGSIYGPQSGTISKSMYMAFDYSPPTSTTTITVADLQQYYADGTTTLPEFTSSSTVGFRGSITSNGSSTVKLQVETEPSSTSFTDTANMSSTASSSVYNALVTSTYSNGDYHWQARAIDGNGVTSTWQAFGPSTTSTDFTVNTSQSFPGIFQSGYSVTTSTTNKGVQISFVANSSTVNSITVLGSWFQHFITQTSDWEIFFAKFNSPGISSSGCTGSYVGYNENTETKSQVTTVTSTLYGFPSATFYFATPTILTGNCYNFTFDQPDDTASTGTVQLANGHQTGFADAYFYDQTREYLGAPMYFYLTDSTWINDLNQYKSDATTTIPENGTTTENTVVFGGILNSAGTSTLQLQVEVTTSTSFTGTPNVTSSVSVASGTYATSTLIKFPEESPDGNYHWQARVIDQNGVTSTWQTPAFTDFVMKIVPLYTQTGSPYPSFASTSVVDGGWGGDTYDDGTIYCGGGNKVGYCGCAITSVVMWLRYYGIATDASGTTVDPRDLNDWLTANGGYTTPGGDLNWSDIPNYAHPPGGGSLTLDPNSPYGYGTSTSAMKLKIDSLLSSSTPDPVILYEANAPEGTSTTTHFVVATGFANNAGTSTYTVRDTSWYLTNYLNQATSTNTSSTINGYSNIADGAYIFYDPPVRPMVNSYAINLPNSLMLVDSQGRRTGKDPITGIAYHEIPGTSYFEEGNSGQLYFSAPPSGQYTVYILGGAAGRYYLNYWVDDGGSNPPKREVISGDIQKGSMIAYVQNYDTANIASSTLSASSTASSTASITSAPPNNLPPPPVPVPVPRISPPQSFPTPIITISSSTQTIPSSTLNSALNTSSTKNNE